MTNAAMAVDLINDVLSSDSLTTMLSNMTQPPNTTSNPTFCTLTQSHLMAAYIVNLIASCLSVIGSAAIILNYFLFLSQTKRNQVLYRLILFLSIADFFGSLSICISQSVLLMSYKQSGSFCVLIRASINYFFLSSFVWMSCIAFHAYWSSRQRSQTPLFVFHVLSWGLPTVMTIAMLWQHAIVQEQNANYCHLEAKSKWIYWYGPLMLTFVWNIVLYAMILWKYRHSVRPMSPDYLSSGSINTQHSVSTHFVNERKKKMHGKVARQLGIYLMAFIICWLPDLIDGFVPISERFCRFYWLWLVQNFTTPLQGFLNFIVYGVASRMFLRCKRKEPLDLRSLNEKRQQKISILRGVVE
ncbi:hypothetical protein SAMD00019534_098500, partial [Acytostelium subglobosum LB1]|uniref:hypothetical protein n=1 Tax=Acytostelium subglobosum LB1 TaxID=1410327 RepID=UPI00064519E9